MANRLHNKVVKKGLAKKQKPVPVKIVSDAPMKTSYPEEDKKWRAQNDLRSLQEAEQIRADKSRFNAAKTEAKLMLKGLNKVCR